MNDKKETFTLKINGKVILDIELGGSERIVDAFTKEVFLDSFSIFYKSKEKLSNMIINGLEVSAQMVFRDTKGKFVSPDKLLKKVKVKQS